MNTTFGEYAYGRKLVINLSEAQVHGLLSLNSDLKGSFFRLGSQQRNALANKGLIRRQSGKTVVTEEGKLVCSLIKRAMSGRKKIEDLKHAV